MTHKPSTASGERVRELDAELAGLDTGIDAMKALAADKDLSPIDADVVRFHMAQLKRRRRELVTRADIITIASEFRLEAER